MRMRLVRVEVAGGQPAELGLPEVRRDPPDDVPHIALQVGDPFAMLRRDDEPEVVAIGAPGRGLLRRIQALRRPVEELGPGAVHPGAAAAQIAHMARQGAAACGPLALVPADQGLDDHPLPHVQTERPAGASLRRPEHP